MSKLEAIKKILADRLVDKIDFSDMQKVYEESYYRRFMKELEGWQREAERIITDSGVILQGDIKAGDIHSGDAKKIKLPLELPVSTYDPHYIRNAIDILIMVKTIQKQLASCEAKEERQGIVDLINMGRSFRMAEVTFHYPQITDDVICKKNQQIARKKLGVEGPVKQTIRRIIKEIRSGKQKPSYKKAIQMMMDYELMADLYEAIKNPIPIQLLGVYKSKGDSIEIEDNDYDRNNYFKYRLRNGKECKVTFKRIESSLNELKT